MVGVLQGGRLEGLALAHVLRHPVIFRKHSGTEAISILGLVSSRISSISLRVFGLVCGAGEMTMRASEGRVLTSAKLRHF